MENPFLLYFVSLTIFSQMLAIGVNHSVAEITYLWRRPALWMRSLLAVVVLVPLVVVLLLKLLSLHAVVASGLALLACAPGAPLTTKRSQMAGGDPVYAASLQLTLALLAIVIAPLTLEIFDAVFDSVNKRITPVAVALQVGKITFLPVVAGLLLQHISPAFCNRIARHVQTVANALFILLFVVLIGLIALAPQVRGMLMVGGRPTLAIVLMVLISLAIGHFLGGPERSRKSTLAIACIARNVGLALYIAGLSQYGQYLVPTIVSYLIIGALIAVPYAVWSKRKARAGSPSNEMDGP
jgi:BASS family bile acid:Na+ symporter